MLEELSKKDNLWRRIAYNICGDSMLADDLVQEMYLRFHRNPKENVNDYYVGLVIKSIFLNTLKERKNISIEQLHYLDSNDNTFEPDDEQYEILLRASDLKWWEIELIQETYENSYRAIEREFGIHYAWVFKKVKEAKEQILKQ